MLPLLVPRVAPTVIAQESGGVGKGRTRNPVVGVVVVVPPTLFWVSPPSLQLAIQFMLTLWLAWAIQTHDRRVSRVMPLNCVNALKMSGLAWFGPHLLGASHRRRFRTSVAL
jgi:hypothetical protein